MSVYLRFEEGCRPDTLSHFGVKGMHWGVWNDETRRRRLGIRERRVSSAEKDLKTRGVNGPQERKSPSGKGKTAAKVAIGVAAVGAIGGASYLAYKNRDEIKKFVAGNVIAKTKDGTVVHGVKETVRESLANSNPTGNRHNCPVTSITGILRQVHGVDCTAKAFDNPPEMLDLARECFPGCKTIPKHAGDAATAVTFGKSMADAEKMLVKKFGENSSGIVGFEWNEKAGMGQQAGHVISFVVKDGKASFYDFQTGKKNGGSLWKMMNPNGMLQIARLDDAVPDFDALLKYVDFR